MQRTCSFRHLLLINSFVYIAVAMYSPFLSMYYAQEGLTSSQVGILLTIAPIASVLIQPLWAKRSDATGRAKTYAVFILLGLILSLQTFYLGHSFGNYLLSNILLAVFSTSVHPMLDAIVIRNADQEGYNFAYIRMGGTVGYAVVVFLIGIYLRKYPHHQFLLAGLGYLVLLLLILWLPASENHQPVVQKPSQTAKSLRQMFQLKQVFSDRRVAYVLLFAFLFQIGASVSGSYLGVYVASIGYGQFQMGMLNFISAASEIPVLLIVRKLSRRFDALLLIAGATFLMGVRALLVSGGTLSFFIAAQAMQGLTYMIVYYGSATYIAQHAREGMSSQAQSILYMVQSGFACILGNLLGGRIIDAVGLRATYLGVGGTVSVLAVLCYLIMRLHVRKQNKISQRN